MARVREYKGNSIVDFPNSFVVLDLETTGLDPEYDEILEIGAIKIVNGEVVDTYNSLVKPPYEIDEFITELTGISNEMVQDAPSVEEILPSLMNFISDNIIVGHNVNFDINFIYDNLLNCGMDAIKNDYIDTLRISRRLFPDFKHHRLKDMANHYNISLDGSHRALQDVFITFKLFNHLKDDFFEKYGSLENYKVLFTRKSKQHPGLKASDITSSKTEFDEDNMFFDKNVVITGTLEKMLRKDAYQIIVDFGGHCLDKVTKDTDFLILGNNDYNPILRGKKSNKLIAAEKLKIKGQDLEIISENTFYDIIGKEVIEDVSKVTMQKSPLNKEKASSTNEMVYDESYFNTINGIPFEQGDFNEKEAEAYQLVKQILIKNGKNINCIRCGLGENYFQISNFNPVLVLKLRGKKDYAVIRDYNSFEKYNFGNLFSYEEGTKRDGGAIRLMLNSIQDINYLDKYILEQYEICVDGNITYIENVRVGRKNYENYLRIMYQ